MAATTSHLSFFEELEPNCCSKRRELDYYINYELHVDCRPDTAFGLFARGCHVSNSLIESLYVLPFRCVPTEAV